MSIKEIARYAKIKGLQMVGTGDFTHPQWLREIRQTLVPEADTGLFKVATSPESPMRFMLTTEVCTIFDFENKNRKIHHVILTPSVETAVQINVALEKYGNLSADGRPILNMTAPQLVEEVMQVSSENMIFPAHAWTPWFSVFGAFSGFDTIEDCYQDQTKHIHALETGLSSDPPMNWRLSKLDRFTLVSNSDCHSFWPWRMGREANVFELERISYREVTEAIRTNDTKRFKFTIETDPAYGKYHWTGHRNCSVSMSPQEARKRNNVCPVCGRKLTEGVEQRVEELADRPADYKSASSPGFMRLLPLSEIIAAVLNVDSPSTQTVWKIYNSLISKFGDEYAILIDAPKEALGEVAEKPIADAIAKVREGAITVVPGYDGVYGKLVLSAPAPEASRLKLPPGSVQQLNLADFW
jgi:uncharacterized protein (TIGR00375 family)